MLAFDKAADDGNLAEGAFEQIATLDPVNKFVCQYIGGKQRRRIGNRFQTPHAKRIVAGDKAHWHEPPALHPPRYQHPQ
jgi:hypothetical protein